jgi:hypothetical protein
MLLDTKAGPTCARPCGDTVNKGGWTRARRFPLCGRDYSWRGRLRSRRLICPVYLRDVRQAGQDRRERHAETRRHAGLDLLGAAEDLRTTVANAADYRGGEMSASLADIRNVAAAVQRHAA